MTSFSWNGIAFLSIAYFGMQKKGLAPLVCVNIFSGDPYKIVLQLN